MLSSPSTTVFSIQRCLFVVQVTTGPRGTRGRLQQRTLHARRDVARRRHRTGAHAVWKLMGRSL